MHGATHNCQEMQGGRYFENQKIIGKIMSEPIEILRGVVHPWYCDNFGHMNVRWYSHFFDDAAFHLWPLYWGSHQKMQDEFGVHTVVASATIQFRRNW